MNEWIKIIALTLAMSVVVAAAQRYLLLGPAQGEVTFSRMTGEILSIDQARDGEEPKSSKIAVIKLSSGEVVRATIPPSCVVFPGQQARLVKPGQEGMR